MSIDVTMRTGDVETAVARIAARVAGVPAGASSAATPFALMGLDSLGLLELAEAIEETLGVAVPMETLVECPDARSLAAMLASGERPAEAFDTMLADAVLPDDIRPPGTPAWNDRGLRAARCILLTGATGFLGSWMAARLLEDSAATLICPVRSNGHDPRRRIVERLRGIGVPAETIDARVQVIPADLSLPRIGMDPDVISGMVHHVDAICHAGAAVNWSVPYHALRAANVAATRELLRFASLRGVPFHFVSSVSVCYSTSAPATVHERFDPRDHIRGVHLGYAQSKAVAEMLVSGAGRRGLPVSIYRPALISGHSATGDFNADDIVARLVKGCIRMAAAPDLDWTLDALPVDVAARQIVELSSSPGIFHLTHPRPRHWRECVLWMRLYGYDVTLLPYHDWLGRLDRDTSHDPAHPLAALRPFFLSRPAGARGLTLPELYENVRRTRVLQTATTAALRDSSCPDLDAALLERYFEAFIERGHVERPRSQVKCADGPRQNQLDARFFARALERGTGVTGLGSRAVVVDARRLERSSAHSIIGELTAWRSPRPTGVFRYELTVEDAAGSRTVPVFVKVKARDDDAIAVGEALAGTCDPRVGAAFARWRNRLGLTGAQARELALYQHSDSRFVRHLPPLLGADDDPCGTSAMVLEAIDGAVLLDSADHPHAWQADHIDAALHGLARLHAVWYGRGQELRDRSWIGFVADAPAVSEMSDLWSALAAHAAPAFSSWADPSLGVVQELLTGRVESWWPALDRQTPTLIHHDFNPRNICLRRTGRELELCAYDWELATIGAPQRDLAELLCFVLDRNASDSDIDRWIERSRLLLEMETGMAVAARSWRDGFAAAVYDIMLRRLPVYALVHRIRPQAFLPRVVQTWHRLYQRFPLEPSR